MNRKLIVLILLLFITRALYSADNLVEKKFYSPSLQQEKSYYISLPDGYNPNDKTRRYPVIVFLHSASVTPKTFRDVFEPLYFNLLGRLIFPNLFKAIFVMPDGSVPPYHGSFYTNSTLYGNFEDYIVNDLTKELISNYNVHTDRSKWGIMGHSMGAYGAMKIALKHPDFYAGVATLSAPLHITYYQDLLPMVLSENGSAQPYNFTYSGDVTKLLFTMAGAFSPAPEKNPPVNLPIDANGNLISEIVDLWDTHNPIQLIRHWKGNPSMGVFIYCGKNDEYALYKHNTMFCDSMNKYQLKYEFKDDNGDHTSGIVTNFPTAYNFLFNVLDTTQRRMQPTDEFVEICQGESYLHYSDPGVYSRIEKRVNGFDSIVNAHVAVNAVYHIDEDISVCSGEFYQSWSESGTYTRNLASKSGCDSLVTTHLTILPKHSTEQNIVIDEGENYMGETITGIYFRTFTNQFGCDSLVTFNLQVNNRPVAIAGSDKTFCEGDTIFIDGSLSYDINLDSISYVWQISSQVQLTDKSSPTQTIAPAQYSGTNKILLTLIVNDGRLDSATDSIWITIAANPPKPSIEANGSLTFCAGDSVTLSAPGGYTNYRWNNGMNTQQVNIYESIALSVQIQSSAGCLSEISAPVQVEVLPQPVKPAFTVSGDQLISTSLTNNNWFLNQETIQSTSSNTYIITRSGLYRLQIIDSNGCRSELSESIFVHYSKQDSLEQCIKVYPIPTNGQITIENYFVESNITFELCDFIGRKIMQIPANKTKTEIDLTPLPAGIYFITTANKTTKPVKLVKY